MAAGRSKSNDFSSSPGIALKQEGITYIAGAELPCVIVNIMRVDQDWWYTASQADYFMSTRGGGNGDYRTPVYAPATVQEAVIWFKKHLKLLITTEHQ